MKEKTVVIFSAGTATGFICCGTLVTRAFLSSEKMRKVLSEAIASKICNILFDEKTQQYQHSRPSPKKSVKYQLMFDSRDIVFDTWEDAKDVLRYLKETLNTYGAVTVADFRELAGKNEIGFSDMNYGWLDLTGAHIERISSGAFLGYTIVLQKPVSLY